jgi:hypothetical protein
MASIWALVAFVVVLLAATQRLFLCIKRDDPNRFGLLGEPNLFTNNNPTNIYKFWYWIFTPGANEKMSMEGRVLVWILRIGTPIYVLCIVLETSVFLTAQ